MLDPSQGSDNGVGGDRASRRRLRASGGESRRAARWPTGSRARIPCLRAQLPASGERLSAARSAARCAAGGADGARPGARLPHRSQSHCDGRVFGRRASGRARRNAVRRPAIPKRTIRSSASPAGRTYLVLGYPWIGAISSDTSHLSYCKLFNVMDQCEALRAAYSPDLFVTKETPPTFWYHTFNDQTVPVEQGMRFYEALIKAGVPSEAHIFANGPHGTGLGGRRCCARPVAGAAGDMAARAGAADAEACGAIDRSQDSRWH